MLKDYSSCGCEAANEPLIACEEGVIGCGACKIEGAVPAPTKLRIEQLEKRNGIYTLKVVDEICIDMEGSPCLPGVQLQRHTGQFRDWYAESRKFGAIDSSLKAYTIFKEKTTAMDQEGFFILMLDTQCYARAWGELARGTRDSVNVPIPDVLRLPLVEGAQTIVIIHNHPSGKKDPSDADKQLTKQIDRALRTVKMRPLMDHLVIGADGYFSFADEGLL